MASIRMHRFVCSASRLRYFALNKVGAVSFVCQKRSINYQIPLSSMHGHHGDTERRMTGRYAKHIEPYTQHNEEPSRTTLPDSTWLARLANENGYLSWCRNAYLSTAVAFAMFAGGNSPSAEYAAYGIVAIACANHLGGTLSYIYYTLALRKRFLMSPVTAFTLVILALMHFLIWLSFVLLFTDSIGEEKEREREVEEREKEAGEQKGVEKKMVEV